MTPERPVVVRDRDGELYFFSSRAAAERYVEPRDVEHHEYEALDVTGCPLTLSVVRPDTEDRTATPKVRIEASGHAVDLMKLREWLLEGLALRGFASGAQEIGPLLTKASQIFGPDAL